MQLLADPIFLNPVIALAWFIALWLSVTYILSSASGLRRLASIYPALESFKDAPVIIASGYIGGVSFRNCLNIKVIETGFCIYLNFMFSAFTKPIFIPWEMVSSVEAQKKWFFVYYAMKLKQNHTDIMLSGKAGKKIYESFQYYNNRVQSKNSTNTFIEKQ